MSTRAYLILSGALFGAVAVLHLLRVLGGWDFVIGSWPVPMSVSWLGTLIPGFLCFWAFRLATRT